MKKIFLLFFILFLESYVFAQHIQRVLTLDECIKCALSINHDILINKESISLAEQRTKEAKALYFPVVDLNFNLSKYSNDVATVMNSSYLPVTILLPEGRRDYFYSTRISLWQNIYNGGRIIATNKLAKINQEKAQTNYDVTKNEVVAKVKIQFYKNISIKSKIHIYKKYLLSDSTNILLQEKLEILQHEYELEIFNLLALIGLELDTVVDIAGHIDSQKLDLDLQQCILWAYQFRPEIKTTQYQESIDNIAVNLINMEKFPTVKFGVSYDWLGDNVNKSKKDWYVALNINYPIFDGGAVFSRLKQKKIKARQATIERSKIEEKIKLEVMKAFSEYKFWYKKFLKIKNMKATTIEQEILKEDIKYNYIKSLVILDLAIGK